MFFMPELSKWIRAERVLRWKTREGGGGWGFSLGEKTAGQLPELVRVSQRGNSLAQRNMEFIKRFGIYRINWIGKANTLNKSGAKLV